MDAFFTTQERRIYRSEARLIASVLRGQRGLAWLATHLKPLDFSDYRHQLIWNAMLTLHHRGVPVCAENVLTELASRSLDDDAGGQRYLRRLERMSIPRKFSESPGAESAAPHSAAQPIKLKP